MSQAITTRSRLLAPARCDAERAYRFIEARPNGAYTPADVRFIVDRYWATCKVVGLDPLLVAVQMAHETGFLSSYWAARPRRNPAGIGVTGVQGAGIAFESWEAAVRAHAGRLLAYALKPRQGTAAQRALVTEALRWRPLPVSYRGIAPTLGQLTSVWAADPAYGSALTRLANEVVGRRHGDSESADAALVCS